MNGPQRQSLVSLVLVAFVWCGLGLLGAAQGRAADEDTCPPDAEADGAAEDGSMASDETAAPDGGEESRMDAELVTADGGGDVGGVAEGPPSDWRPELGEGGSLPPEEGMGVEPVFEEPTDPPLPIGADGEGTAEEGIVDGGEAVAPPPDGETTVVEPIDSGDGVEPLPVLPPDMPVDGEPTPTEPPLETEPIEPMPPIGAEPDGGDGTDVMPPIDTMSPDWEGPVDEGRPDGTVPDDDAGTTEPSAGDGEAGDSVPDGERPNGDEDVVLHGTLATGAERVTLVLERTAEQIALLSSVFGGMDVASERIASIEGLLADAREALAAGAVDYARALAERIGALVSDLREEAAAQRGILDASADLSETLAAAGAAGQELADAVVATVRDLLAQAEEAARAGDFETAEALRDQSEDLLDSARDEADLAPSIAERAGRMVERTREELARLASELEAAGATEPLATTARIEQLLAEAERVLAGDSPEAVTEVLAELAPLMAAARAELGALIALHDAADEREGMDGDGVALPEPRKAEVDDLLARANEAAAAGDFEGAEDLAETARGLLGDSRDETLRLQNALELTRMRLARLVAAFGGSSEQEVVNALAEAQSLMTEAEAALSAGATDDARALLTRMEDAVDGLRGGVDARADIGQAHRALEATLAGALAAGIALPPDGLAALQDRLDQADATREAGDFATAERLAEEAQDMLVGLRESVEGLRESAIELAEGVREVATQLEGSAAEVEDLLAAAADLGSEDALALVEEALLVAAEAGREADRAAERARRAAERADEDQSDESTGAAEDAGGVASGALATALGAARSVYESAARVADTTRLAAVAARNAFDTEDIASRRAAESTLDEDVRALRRAAEAIDLIVESAQQAAELATEQNDGARRRADATGAPEDLARAEAAAAAAAAAVQALEQARGDSAVKATAAAEANAQTRALLADTDALEAEGRASEAASQPALEAQTLARDAASILRTARARAEEAVQAAELAEARSASSDDDAVRAAAERARAAALRAQEATQRAENAARQAGKHATDVDDDGANNIRDLIRVAMSFGSPVQDAELPVDIDGDGRLTVLDLVLTAQGIGAGAILPTGSSATAAAPVASFGRLLARARALPDRLVEVEFLSAAPIDTVGLEFDLRLASDRVRFVEAGPRQAASRRPNVFELEPLVTDNAVRGGYVRLGESELPADGFLTRVVLRAPGDDVSDEVPLLSARMTVVDAAGNVHNLLWSGRDVAFEARSLPERPMLHQNFPNPFNPETWIPYELSSTSDVQISVYDSAGRHVRTLDLGRQAAGSYVDRSRAAYWDGRNDAGEPAASGVYFYRLDAGDYSEMRRLVVHK